MKPIAVVSVTLVAFLTFLIPVHAADLTANTAKLDLTPPLETKFALGGYGARVSKPAVGVHDRIFAKALVLNNGVKKYAIVTLDVLALPPNVKPQILERLQGQGWSVENVMLLSSHTHSSLDMTALNDQNNLDIPQLGIFQPQLLEFVVKSVAQVIIDANQGLQAVKVATASAMIPNMNRNRRGDKFTDAELTVTRFDLIGGKPLAVLVNWTAHPTFVDEQDMWVSGEWPGYLQRELEAWIGDGITTMYFNGAEGDQSPAGAEGASPYERVEDYGRKIAIEAHKLYGSIKPQKNVAFDYGYQVLSLQERKAHPDFLATGGAEYGIDEAVMKLLLEKLVPEKSASGAVRIGELLIAGVPGELAAGLGLQIKNRLRQAGVRHPVIGGLANEWISYILSVEEYNKGGYEASVSFYGSALGSTIVEGVLKAAIPLAKR